MKPFSSLINTVIFWGFAIYKALPLHSKLFFSYVTNTQSQKQNCKIEENKFREDRLKVISDSNRISPQQNKSINVN